MDEIRFEGRSDLDEVRRRIRLSGLVTGAVSATASEMNYGDGVEFLIDLSPSEAALASQIEALFHDVPVIVVTQGIVSRPIEDGDIARFPRWEPPT